MGTFKFWTWSNGSPLLATVRMELDFARWLVDSDYVTFGVWEDLTNRVYL